MPGVFAAGDVRHGSVKRVASAVGEGAIAVQLVHEYLAESRPAERGEEVALREKATPLASAASPGAAGG